MVTCSDCGKQIPADEMAGARGMRVWEEHRPELAAALEVQQMVTKAYKCDGCGKWICNECVSSFISSHGPFPIEHGNCGGTFRAP